MYQILKQLYWRIFTWNRLHISSVQFTKFWDTRIFPQAKSTPIALPPKVSLFPFEISLQTPKKCGQNTNQSCFEGKGDCGYPIIPAPFVEKLSFLPFATLVKIDSPHMFGVFFEITLLFPWCSYFSVCQCHVALTNAVLF